MGTIRVGQKKPKQFTTKGWTTVSKEDVGASKDLDKKDETSVLEDISGMPEVEQVSALRAAGFSEKADALERQLAEKHIQDINAEMRKKRLDEIMGMDLSDQDRLQLLLEEKFDAEASELSEKMAEANKADVSTDLDGTDAEEANANESKRPKRSESGKGKETKS